MLMLALAGAVQAADEYLCFNGVEYTTSMAVKIGEGQANWNMYTKTLTLENVIINNEMAEEISGINYSAGILYRGGSETDNLTIVLKGKNYIKDVSIAILVATKSGYADNGLTLTGSGSLSIDATAGGKWAIYANRMNMDGATADIKAKSSLAQFYPVFLLSNLSLTNGSKLTVAADCDQPAVRSGVISVSDSEIEVTNTRSGKECIRTNYDVSALQKNGVVLLLGDHANAIQKRYAGTDIPASVLRTAHGYAYAHIYTRGGELSGNAEMAVDASGMLYDGTAKTPKVTVKDSLGTELSVGTDYTVSYKDNINPGTASAVVTGAGVFSGTLTKTFTIGGLAPGQTCVDAGKNAYKVLTPDTMALTSWKGSGTTASVPAEVTCDGIKFSIVEISAGAFKNNTKIRKVVIPETVTAIGSKAFYGCTKLNTVTIGKNVTTIGNYAFYKCAKLKSIVIPAKVSSIGDFAFAYDSKLASLTLGKSVSAIGKKAFYKCIALKKVTLPASVTKIGLKAFCGCAKLSKIIVKTTTLKSAAVGTRAFYNLPDSAVVKVPKSVLKAYTKLFVKKGLTKDSQSVKAKS